MLPRRIARVPQDPFGSVYGTLNSYIFKDLGLPKRSFLFVQKVVRKKIRTYSRRVNCGL